MRLIDADALGIGKCNPDVFENKGYASGWNAAIGLINAAPTEVVRCAECEHWDGPDDGYTHSCDVDAWVRPGWWFCPAGQRREDGDA